MRATTGIGEQLLILFNFHNFYINQNLELELEDAYLKFQMKNIFFEKSKRLLEIAQSSLKPLIEIDYL